MKNVSSRYLFLLVAACAASTAYGDETVEQPSSATSADTNAPEISDKVGIYPGTTTIDGQYMEIYLGREMRVFGNAEIHQDGNYIKGDQIYINTQNDEIHAIGNVKVKQNDIMADGPELRLKMEDRVGQMEQPDFKLGVGTPTPSRGNAETVFFEGPGNERLTKAKYTTCPEGNNDWYLTASEMKIDQYTETVTASNARVDFKGVPIFYTPWMDFPFTSQRKSGFLTPTIGTTTKNGLELSVPYYWNIAPNMDATLAARMMSKRGTQLWGEHRYLGEQYSGTSNIELLPNDDATGKNRYFINLNHAMNFGGGVSGNITFSKVSDNQYFTDMSTNIVNTSRVNLPQQASLRYDVNNWHAAALVQRYQTLDNASFPYQRLPQLTLSNTEDYEIVTTNLSSEFVRFEKASSAPTSVEGNRLTVNPSISVPFIAPYGYITPKFGVHYTKYDLSGNTAFTNSSGLADNYQSMTRVLPTFSVDSGIYFDRDMRVVKNHYTQTLEPRLFYVYIPSKDQSRLPIFDTGLSDLNLSTIFSENQFSGGDRINDANQVTMALTSRMLDQKSGAQRLSATIGERFYFSDQEVVLPGGTPRSSNRSDILTALNMQLTNGWYIDAAYQFNTDTDSTVRSNVTARYQPAVGRILNLSYRYTVNSVEQIDISSQWPLGRGWYGVGRLNYSLRDNPPTDERGPIEYLAGVEYNAGCWLGRFVFQRLPTATVNATAKPNYAFFFQLELNGLSKIGSNPLELLNRNIRGYVNSSQLPADNPPIVTQ